MRVDGAEARFLGSALGSDISQPVLVGLKIPRNASRIRGHFFRLALKRYNLPQRKRDQCSQSPTEDSKPKRGKCLFGEKTQLHSSVNISLPVREATTMGVFFESHLKNPFLAQHTSHPTSEDHFPDCSSNHPQAGASNAGGVEAKPVV